jgi:hypothetical protein
MVEKAQCFRTGGLDRGERRNQGIGVTVELAAQGFNNRT